MTDFVTIISRIKDILGIKNDNDIAQALGMKQNAFSLRKKRDSIPYDEIVSICDKKNISFDYIITGKGPKYREFAESPPDINEKHAGYEESAKPDISAYCQIPLYNVKASAGYGATVNSEKLRASLMFCREWVHRELLSNPAHLFILRAESDSMEPTIRHDALLMVDKTINRVISEGIYILRRDDTILVKRVRKLPEDTIELISDNPIYSKETITLSKEPDIAILGKVIYIWSGRKI